MVEAQRPDLRLLSSTASLLAAAAALLTCTALAHAATTGPAQCGLEAGTTHAVTDIVDATTLRIDSGQEVRLAGIVTPHAIDSASTKQAWLPENAAVAALARLARGQRVTLYPMPQGLDRHGRLLAHVALEAAPHSWLQAELLRSGHARAFGLAQDFVCANELLAHERVAEDARAGLWADRAYQVRQAYRTRELMRFRSTLQIVTGRVRKITVTKNAIYLEFGRDWRQDFTAGVKMGRASAWSTEQRDWLKSLERQRVRVRGFIERRNGPYIEIGHPSEIEVLADVTSPALSSITTPDAAKPGAQQSATPVAIPSPTDPPENKRPKP